jgi:hypothetical protein
VLCVGEVAEWLKAHAWKACLRVSVTGVRIPVSPPVLFVNVRAILMSLLYPV